MNNTMKAMVLEAPGTPLQMHEVARPLPGPGKVLLRVSACGICRTDLHVIDGELPNPKLPLIPGHQIVGEVVATGKNVETITRGQRVGVAWLGRACGQCRYCTTGRENLCDNAQFTGYNLDGGYAEYTVADERFCFALPAGYPDLSAAPLLCAGLIGYRSLAMTGNAGKIGFYGFGSAAHIIIQVALHQGRKVFVFTRSEDEKSRAFARKLGAVWTGASTQLPPAPLDAAIIFAPVGALVPLALRAVAKGGTVVCAGIHMSDIPSFPYQIMWEERILRSVANLTRRDGLEFMELAGKIKIRTEIRSYPLAQANEALSDLRRGLILGTAVLTIRQQCAT